MLSRVSNFASNQLVMSHVTTTRSAVDDLQIQLASGRISQSYSGYAASAERLVGMEADVTVYERFQANNDHMDRRLQATEDSLVSIRSTVNDLRFSLIEFGKTERTDPAEVRLIQEQAFKTLEGLQALLNSEHDGRYLFSGTKLRTEPVAIDASTLDEFQQRYDGVAVAYPTTREAHLANVSLSDTEMGALTFDEVAGTITAADPQAFDRVPVGATVTLAGAGANSGSFTVLAKPGANTLTVAAGALAAQPPAAAATLSIQSYYRGDSVGSTHRADSHHELDLGLNAIDPSFEKLVRALGLLAQGDPSGTGGLATNPARVDQSLYLINSALELSVSGTPPFGTEANGNLVETEMAVGFQRTLLSETNERLASRVSFLEGAIADTEVADQTETSLRLFDRMNALEASLATVGRIRQITLTSFI